MLEVGGKGISDRGLARICHSGRQAVATSRRRRTKRVVQNAKTGTNAARKLRFGTKGPYKNKVDHSNLILINRTLIHTLGCIDFASMQLRPCVAPIYSDRLSQFICMCIYTK